MPSALCSISHWVQILDTAVRDQPPSQPPAAGACHRGQLCGGVLEEPQQPPCSLGSYARVMQEPQSTSLAGGSACPPQRDGVWGHPSSSCQCFGTQEQQQGWPQPEGCHSPDPDPGLPLGDVPCLEGTATLPQQHGANTHRCRMLFAAGMGGKGYSSATDPPAAPILSHAHPQYCSHGCSALPCPGQLCTGS